MLSQLSASTRCASPPASKPSKLRALLAHLSGFSALTAVLLLPFLLQRLWPVVTYSILKTTAIFMQPRSCSCPLDATAFNARRRDAIIMLVQKKRMGLMMGALAGLHKYFNSCFRKDVLLFHNGDFTEEDQKEVMDAFPRVQFHLLAVGGKWWQVPHIEESHRARWKSVQSYTAGYRHMIRFNYKMVFEYLEKRGYEWFMRVDDDSFLLSCIQYDMFQFMEDRGQNYGWRLAQLEIPEFATGLPEMVGAYMRDRRIAPSYQLVSHYEGGLLTTESWDRWCFYNNFMITRIAWWRSSWVSRWLDKVDSSGIAYVHRVGDAPIQTFTAMMFMPRSEVHHFQDWSYCHGPMVSLSLNSILPAELRPLLVKDGEGFDWVGGLYDMSEFGQFKPISRLINPYLNDWMLAKFQSGKPCC